MSMTSRGDGVYRDSRTGHLYHRPVIGGRRTWRKLKATSLTMGRREVAALNTRQLESRLNIGIDPYARLVTVGQIAAVWKKEGCPDRKGIARHGKAFDFESGKLSRLLPFWNGYVAREITIEDCRDYWSWRRKQSKRFRLARSVDAELTTLSSMLTWAVQNPRKTGLRANPLAVGRPRFDKLELVRHCTSTMPMTDEDLHSLASYLLASNRSRPLGWQLLLEALTGARSSEILVCRLDADKPRQPGFQDDHALHLARLKKGIEPWALLEVIPGHRPLAEMLIAFRSWHKKRYADCLWFIPNRFATGPADRCSLTHALKPACDELGIATVTSHGLRAYFVRTLRSLAVDDSEIAKRLGHRSGVELVEKTYGVSEPGWFGCKKLDFLPAKNKPAWNKWLPRKNRKIVEFHGRAGSNPSNRERSIHVSQLASSPVSVP